MVSGDPIQLWDRQENCELVEKIYGDAGLRWLYETRLGFFLTRTFLSKSWLSRLVGMYQSSRWSRRRVPSFIKEFEISIEEFEVKDYASFNDFFCRRFREGARTIVSGDTAMAAFAEGRYLVFESVREEQTFPVKGCWLSAAGILGGEERARPFLGGPLVIARLCPVDYHRFHYPDSGATRESYRLAGRLHSVHPIALKTCGRILATNERRVSILETENFGKLAYVEVGALNVGRIVQTHPAGEPFQKGGEKGYFLFGGSTVLLMGEPGRWKPDEDLLARTRDEQEVFVRLGERIASSA